MASTAAAAHAEHEHAGPATYVKIAVVLFILTGLEVWGFEVVHSGSPAALAAVLKPIFVETLLVLSALKFWLVAMFYMHLKFDGRLLKWIFGFSLVIATVVIGALMALFWYLFNH